MFPEISHVKILSSLDGGQVIKGSEGGRVSYEMDGQLPIKTT